MREDAFYRFLIIDDQSEHIATLKDYLTHGFGDHSVVDYDKECSSWDVAVAAVKKFPDDPAFVAFFDLSLPSSEVADASAGLERVRALRAQRQQWTMLSYTRFGEISDILTEVDECFDGEVSKQRIHAMKRDARIAYVKSAVIDAVSKHHHHETSVPAYANFIDSFGMRVFRATFGDNTVTELLDAEASKWNAPRVTALTTGHSGAHLIEVSAGNESLVLKVARSAAVIEHEIAAVGENLARLGPFNSKLAHVDSDMKTLFSGAAVYYRQAIVAGDSLLSLVISSNVRESMLVLDKVANFSIETASPYRTSKIRGRAPFKFSLVDRGRFQTSVSFLIPLAKTMVRRRLLDTAPAALERLRKRTIALVENWDTNPVVTAPTFLVLQHGDFNPGNILVTKAGDLVLIDLARFGDWPPGYDLARLALMLRLRLIDRRASEDWLPFKLRKWLAEEVAAIASEHGRSGTCSLAMRCDEIFRSFVENAPDDDRATLRHGYQLGSIWDLIKVVSYQDASQFKRLWALFELDRLARSVGAIR